VGDTIDLASVSYSNGGSATLESGNVLQITQNGNTYDLNLDPSLNYFGVTFQLSADAGGGTNVTDDGVLPNPAPPADTTADMIMRDGNNGASEIYDIGNNTILAAYSMGQVDPEWQVAGLAGFNGTDTSDMLLRNSNTDAFEVLDISNKTITSATSMGQVGLELTRFRLRRFQ
jgi:hypothetical protein